MRNLRNVINKILIYIPKDQDLLLEGIKNIQSSVEFSAPEMMQLHWQRVAEILKDEFPEKLEDMTKWQREVIAIWADDRGLLSVEESRFIGNV